MSFINEKRLFYIDSHNRISGTHSDFLYELKYKDEDDHVVLLQATIPKSYYLVQSGQNTFTLQEGISSAIITLPPGNYSRSSFQTQLQSLLNSTSPNHWTYAISIPNTLSTGDTGLYTYTVTGNTSQPQFIIGNYLYEQLGFDANTTYTFLGNTLVSTNVVKFQLEDSIFIHSDIANNGTDNILQEILAVDTLDYSNITFTCYNVEAYAKPMSTNKNNVYRFYVTDEDDNAINLNGQNVVFTLLLFKKDPLNKVVKQFIKLMLMQ